MKNNKKEYLIIGNNNYWYASCTSMKAAKREIKNIMKHPERYGDQAMAELESLYIYKATKVNEIILED